MVTPNTFTFYKSLPIRKITQISYTFSSAITDYKKCISTNYNINSICSKISSKIFGNDKLDDQNIDNYKDDLLSLLSNKQFLSCKEESEEEVVFVRRKKRRKIQVTDEESENMEEDLMIESDEIEESMDGNGEDVIIEEETVKVYKGNESKIKWFHGK